MSKIYSGIDDVPDGYRLTTCMRIGCDYPLFVKIRRSVQPIPSDFCAECNVELNTMFEKYCKSRSIEQRSLEKQQTRSIYNTLMGWYLTKEGSKKDMSHYTIEPHATEAKREKR